MIKRRTYEAKATVENADEGIVHAVVSVFGNVDCANEIVVKGAFARCLKERKAKGKLPPGVWAHDWSAPVAKTLDAWEADDGLHVIGQFNLETQRGRETFSDIKAEIITEYSFGYEVMEDARNEKGQRLLKDLELFEWSPVLVGCNRETFTVGVKDIGTGLSDYAASSASIAAICNLMEALIYGPVMMALYDEQATDAERLAAFDAAVVQWTSLVRRFFQAALSGEDGVKTAAALEEIHALYPRAVLKNSGIRGVLISPKEDEDPEAIERFKARWRQLFQIPDPAASAGPVSKADEAEAALKAAIEELRTHLEARQKDGRPLSDADREHVQSLQAKLEALGGQLTALAAVREKASPDLVRQVLIQSALTQARQLGVPVSH